MATIDDVRDVVKDTLQLGAHAAGFGVGTRLLGAIPELDSIAVVNLITTIEERFGISIGDDEISAENFETLGALSKFVEHKLAAT